MRWLTTSFLLVLTVILSQQTSAQSANITFRASLKNNHNTSLSDVYVRIYGPDQAGAVDSLFSDEEGNIEQQLPFSWSGPNSIDNKYTSQPFVAPMTPNIVSGATPSVRIEYNYPAVAALIFTDIQGKRHLNGSLFSSGLYFYFLEFDDGYRSDVQKMLLTERCNVNVELINLYQGYAVQREGAGLSGLQSASSEGSQPTNISPGGGSQEGSALKLAPLEELFYAEFIKEGYETLRDTIQINSAVIEKNYQLEAVDPPSAAFGWSGGLLTGKPVVFDASASTGAYGEELVYAWDFGDGKKGQSAGIPHIFIAPGSYEVKLTVSGSYGATHYTSQTVTILADQTATQFSGTVIGSITDMDGMDLKDVLIALVEAEQEVQTDHRGMAVLEDLPMGIPLHFRITREGYVTQVVKLTIPENTGEAVFFSSLKERTPAVTLTNAEFGGSLSGVDGASFTLPVRGLIKEDGSTAEGDVSVSLTPVDVAFDEKGKAAFTDAIDRAYRIKAYLFSGYRGDGVHGILKRNGGESAPLKPELKYFRMSEAGSPLAPDWRSGADYSLDDSFLHESATRLEGKMGDTVFVVVAAGTTEGTFDFIFHRVDAAVDITVDDDFMQYPEAQTSSHIAAGYAVRKLGTVTIANGEYSSILPLTIESDYVTLSGQEEEHVLLRNLYNYTNNPVIYFSSEWGNISNLSLSCGISNNNAIETLLEGITLDHIHIKPLEGESRVAGGIKGVGNGMTLRHITMTNSIWGIKIGSNGALLEQCDLTTENCAIELTGENIVIRNNQLEVTSSNRAIITKAGIASSGNQLVEGNTIHMTREGYSDGNGIINIENVTGPAHITSSEVRYNTIHSAGSNAAFSLTLGNPPSTITVENNTYFGSCVGGGKALVLQVGKYDGVSTIKVSNNTFSGMSSERAIMLYGAEYINEDERFAIYNNSFRFSADAAAGAEHCFVEARSSGSGFTDAANFYLVNNIFQGNGTTTLFKFSAAFSIYADYNTVYNFSSYHGETGNIIGAGHDVTDNPLFIDDALHLDPASPAVDKGAGPALFSGIPGSDKEGVARPQGEGYDMGAYER